jgi:chromosome segregation ATPase
MVTIDQVRELERQVVRARQGYEGLEVQFDLARAGRDEAIRDLEDARALAEKHKQRAVDFDRTAKRIRQDIQRAVTDWKNAQERYGMAKRELDRQRLEAVGREQFGIRRRMGLY